MTTQIRQGKLNLCYLLNFLISDIILSIISIKKIEGSQLYRVIKYKILDTSIHIKLITPYRSCSRQRSQVLYISIVYVSDRI